MVNRLNIAIVKSLGFFMPVCKRCKRPFGKGDTIVIFRRLPKQPTYHKRCP